MSTERTVVHVYGQGPEAVERALGTVFANEERASALRLEGTYSAVLRRATSPDLAAGYRYIILRPHAPSQWTPVLALGNRTVGLEAELSRLLGGAPVFSTFVYGDTVSGYRMARDGAEVDRYLSDPTFFMEAEDGGEAPHEAAGPALDMLAEAERGHPERFADLLPAGTAPEDFWRVVLAPGWWEEREGTAEAQPQQPAAGEGDAGDEDEELVDEEDRMRCIGLALELWGPQEYPLAQEPEEIPDNAAGPAIAVAFE
ncbi:MAG TPA: hypothetical protein VJQ45_04190 [Ktedonobacterales bacterium]|nr:hypothetical protein [Ktedonobacterales bacterium]